MCLCLNSRLARPNRYTLPHALAIHVKRERKEGKCFDADQRSWDNLTTDNLALDNLALDSLAPDNLAPWTLSCAKLTGAKFSGAKLSAAKLSRCQIVLQSDPRQGGFIFDSILQQSADH